MFHFFREIAEADCGAGSAEPPAGLVAFYWHFARQAKPLFMACLRSVSPWR